MGQLVPLQHGPVYKPGRPPLPIETTIHSSVDGGVKQGLTAKFESLVHVCVIPTYKEPLGTLRKTIGRVVAPGC
jgi:hypothetical protein